MQNGDHEARNKLIEHNLRLVAHIVKKFENTGEDMEDLISIGTIGLIKGVESFKVGKGTKLSTPLINPIVPIEIKGVESFKVGKGTKLATYAARCIENEVVVTIG